MKREILFRGERIDGEGMVYGDIITTPSVYVQDCILGLAETPRKFTHVIPETIGQFTGLTDKNGVKIFEGDVVKIEKWSTYFKIIWDDFYAKFTVEKIQSDLGRKMDYIPECEVIGNIHDNPEML